LEDAWAESVLGPELLERAHGVWYVAAVHVDAVLRANAIDLKITIYILKKDMRRDRGIRK